jgi:hypothetical protein
MLKATLSLAVVVIGVLPGSTLAQPIGSTSCICKAEGRSYHEGEIVCLKMPQGLQMVRCRKVLNVTSWEKVQDGCPQAFNDTALTSQASCAAPAALN